MASRCTANAALWCEPRQIATQQGQPYKVFTPYWRNLRAQLQVVEPLPVPRIPDWREPPDGLPLAALELLPRIAWAGGLSEKWQPGEAGAQELLEIFGDDAIGGYAHARDLPARHGTSRLSPHLHFGEISPRRIHGELDRRARAIDAKRRPDIDPYLHELGWCEFAHHLLYHFPHTPTDNFNPRFNEFSWAPTDQPLLECWQSGRTGIPLVDAGMCELWYTGWMHNRVRMIVGSFLTRNLRQHWQHGRAGSGTPWLMPTSPTTRWAGNGWPAAAPMPHHISACSIRSRRPGASTRKVTTCGAGCRGLGDAPLALLHEPWRDANLLKRSGYPASMVDLGQSRQRVPCAYGALAR